MSIQLSHVASSLFYRGGGGGGGGARPPGHFVFHVAKRAHGGPAGIGVRQP